MFTAFLYATHINNVPTLIAGPGGQDIAEVLSISMYANGAGQLTLGDECDLSIVERISEADDSIVSVQNMFGKGGRMHYRRSLQDSKADNLDPSICRGYAY